jgi:thioredoxin 1
LREWRAWQLHDAGADCLKIGAFTMRKIFLGLACALSVPAIVGVVSLSNAKEMQDKMMKNAVKPFSAAALMAAQKAGKPIIVSAHADWCPVCRAQAPIITMLTADPANADVVVLRADYDKQRADLKKLGVTGQSTLIAYQGSKEVGRTMGDTDKAKIMALFTATRS